MCFLHCFVRVQAFRSIVNEYSGLFSVNNEPFQVRTISQVELQLVLLLFTVHAVRERDRKFVITKYEPGNPDADDWSGFDAAHIFSLAYLRHWLEFDYSRWVMMKDEDRINSIQNDTLLRSDTHQLFDAYFLSVYPDV